MLAAVCFGPVPASAGCQLKLKPKQAQPTRCQGTGSAGKEERKESGWPQGPGGLALQNAACSGTYGLLTCSETGSGMFFVVPFGAPLPSKPQPLVLQSKNKCPSPGVQLSLMIKGYFLIRQQKVLLFKLQCCVTVCTVRSSWVRSPY